jgi:hypothetical protein
MKQPSRTYSVLIVDMYYSEDKDREATVGKFYRFNKAKEYARRRTRASVEVERAKSTSPEDLKERWCTYGEDCFVATGVGQAGYSGGQELDFFVEHQAAPEEIDWMAFSPCRKREKLPQVNRPEKPDWRKRKHGPPGYYGIIKQGRFMTENVMSPEDQERKYGGMNLIMVGNFGPHAKK